MNVNCKYYSYLYLYTGRSLSKYQNFDNNEFVINLKPAIFIEQYLEKLKKIV